MLKDLGPFPEHAIKEVTSSLVRSGLYDGRCVYASLFFVGSSFDGALPAGAPRRTWSEVLEFIYERFKEYRRIKADHQQWDDLGRCLWKHMNMAGTKDVFVQSVLKTLT